MFTIARKDLVRIAQKSVREEKLPLNNSRALMKTARTMKTVAMGTWRINSNCGCLVGTTYYDGSQTVDHSDIIEQYGPKMFSVGVSFDERLTHYIRDKYPYASEIDTIIRVVD